MNKMWEYPKQQGVPLFIRTAPDYVDAAVFAAAGNKDVSVPAGAKFVLLSGSVNFWVKRGGSSAVPGADITNGSGSELNPTGYELTDVTTLGISVAAAGQVTLAFYAG